MQPTLNNLSSFEYGSYYHFCSTPVIYADSTKVAAARGRLINEYSGEVIRDAASRVSLADAIPMITLLHELDHLRAFYTSIFGLAIWRTSLLVNLLLGHCVRRRTEAEGWWEKLEPSLPLRKWTADKWEAIRQVRGSPKERALLSVMHWAAEIVQFQSALTERLNMTVGQFTELANRVSSLAALHAGRRAPRWTSIRSPEEPYLKGVPFTGRQILEASAMLHAMYVLGSAGYDEKAVSEFSRPFDRETYSRCMAETLDAVRDFQLAAVAFDEALSGDLDVIGGEERILERDHPAWRFKLIVEGMQGIGPLGRGISNNDLEDACGRVKMPSSTVTVGRVLAESKDIDGILGRPSEANLSKQLVDGAQLISLNTDFIQRRALGQLLACLRRRSVDPFRTIQPIPLLVLFQDDLSATAMSDQGGDLSREQFMIGLGDIALSLATWILFLDPNGNAESITKFQHSCARFYGKFSIDFLNRARIADQKGDFEGVIPYLAMIPQHFLQALLAGKLYPLLRWS